MLGVMLFAGGFAPSVVATASEVVTAVVLGLLMGLMLVAVDGRAAEPLLPALSAAVLTGVAFAIRPDIVDLAGPVLVVVPAPRFTQRPMYELPTNPVCPLFEWPSITVAEISPRTLHTSPIEQARIASPTM